uniref:Uncharacterized protein n=1 Tax=Arundo donax TaxID=35708 RepID=A0A0A8YP03_ARUDO
MTYKVSPLHNRKISKVFSDNYRII